MEKARGAGGRAHKSVLPNCAMPESSEPSMPKAMKAAMSLSPVALPLVSSTNVTACDARRGPELAAARGRGGERARGRRGAWRGACGAR